MNDVAFPNILEKQPSKKPSKASYKLLRSMVTLYYIIGTLSMFASVILGVTTAFGTYGTVGTGIAVMVSGIIASASFLVIPQMIEVVLEMLHHHRAIAEQSRLQTQALRAIAVRLRK